MKETGLKKISKVQCQQIRTIAKQRLLPSLLGKVSDQVLNKIEIALKLHLDLE